jgi:hypothetical protein
MENPVKPKLKIGLLMESMSIPAWVYLLLEKITLSEYAEISLVVLNGSAKPPKTFFEKCTGQLQTLVYRAYTYADQRIFRGNPDAFLSKDGEKILAQIPRLVVQPIQKKFSDTISDEDLAKIASAKVDVFIRLGFRILRGGILTVAPGGVWSYHHGDNRVNRGSPPGFWEVMERQPVTGSVLQILDEDLDNGRVLYRSWSATDAISVHRNKNIVYWKSLEFIPRKLQELHALGFDRFFSNLKEEKLQVYSHRLYTAPTNLEAIGLITRHFFRVFRQKIRELFFRTQWFILTSPKTSGWPESLWRYRKTVPPRDRFWADPCVVSHEGKVYLFVEELLYREKKGHLAVMERLEDGSWSAPKKILAGEHHLSHPHVFQYQNVWYLIPESVERRTIELYRCERFPDTWVFDRVLRDDLEAVDATVWNDEHGWWMFANVRQNPGASTWDELFLFFADTPLGPWSVHPQSPIVSDARRARPGGSIFSMNGSVYRPAQDCSGGYGSGLRLQRVLQLTRETYLEEDAELILPTWEKGLTGVHTMSHLDTLTVLDAKRGIL